MQKNFVLVIFLLLFTVTNVQASWAPIAGEISYQINESDRIAVGNVTNIQEYPEYSIVTIEVDEWLMGQLPSDEIEVITQIGSAYINSNEPRFYTGESVILMLQDVNVNEKRFKVTIGEPGKHPVSDRNEIINELGVNSDSSKDEIMNEVESTTKSDNKTPFIGKNGLVFILICVVFVLRRSRN
ncbi:hypothetical protein [Methanohalophilus portucalensis]|uniref:S-layer family duplication domain-containing protein n=2 Tax=Methanohalophilus portucalensis TaxID=39664 RepID=A0A1X7P300_9EURY|nr:hypothetical protein [Methanohalophilus portucalensis]ATU08069.1 hypothetical protein BKM01_04330 [Methanohalophilus portucalensis]RNI10046.1 hypothetical protein EFE41_08280 [Methanohalophilus portucalensis FDF-1]SMH44549.1 hypothetical protein SAMN06264941_2093 [Methanohalophilus portucalensis FDF-1]